MVMRDMTLYADIIANTRENHSRELDTPINVLSVRAYRSVVDSLPIVMVYADDTIVEIENVVTDGTFADHDKEKIVVVAGIEGQQKTENLFAYNDLRVAILGDANDTIVLDIDYEQRPDLVSLEDRTERMADITQIAPQRSAGGEFYQVGNRQKVDT